MEKREEYSQSLEAESSSHGEERSVWESEIEVGSGDFLRLRRIRIPSCNNRYFDFTYVLLIIDMYRSILVFCTRYSVKQMRIYPTL